MTVVFLTESEMERAKRIADVRNSKNDMVPNKRETRVHNDWEIHFAGARGEIAVCKLCNFPPDEHFSYDGDNGDPDLYIEELRAEVKTATYDPPILKLNAITDFRADLIVLCHVHGANDPKASVVTIAGGVSRERFSKDCYTRDFGMGTRVCMNAEDMTPLSTILASVYKGKPK